MMMMMMMMTIRLGRLHLNSSGQCAARLRSELSYWGIDLLLLGVVMMMMKIYI